MAVPSCNLAEFASIGIFEADPQGIALFINPAGRDLLGLGESLHWLDSVLPSHRDDVHAQWLASIAGGQQLQMSVPLSNGRSVDVSARLLPGGGWVGTLIDATERLGRERAEAWAISLLEAIPDMLFLIDAQGRFAEFRGDHSDRLSVLPAEFLGRRVDEVLPASLALQFERAVARARQSHEVQVIEYELDTPAGQGWFEARVGALHTGEWVAIARDFTKERDNERAMRRALDEATRAEQARTHFLANMSHEIRTPLNGVLGIAQILAMTELTKEQRQHLSVLQASGHTLLGILNDVLDISRFESGYTELALESVDVAAVMAEIVAVHRISAQAKELSLTVSSDGALWCSANALRLKQVVANLLVNAIKFTAQGEVHLSLVRQGDTVLLEVSDTGPGIPPDKREEVFSPFLQVDAARSRVHGGAGLGLSIARELVTQMGGEIEAAQSPSGGALLRVSLVASEPSEPNPSLVEAAPGLRPLSIVLAEDTQTSAMLLQVLLEADGHSVVVVRDGASALERVTELRPDVLLLDLHMPGADGLQTMSALRERGLRVAVIAVTADVMPETRARCQQAGMKGFVAKPFSVDELRRALAQAVSPSGVTASSGS